MDSRNPQLDGLLRLRSAAGHLGEIACQVNQACGAVRQGQDGIVPVDKINQALGTTAELINAAESTIDTLEQLRARHTMQKYLHPAADRMRDGCSGVAAKLIDEMVAAAQKRYGANSVCLADVLEEAAQFFYNMGDRERHLQLLAQAAETRRGAVRVKPELSNRQLALAHTLTELAAAYARHAKHILARDTSEEATYHFEVNRNASHPFLLHSRQMTAYYQSMVPQDS